MPDGKEKALDSYGMGRPSLGATARLLLGTIDIHTLLSLRLFLSGRIRLFTLKKKGFCIFYSKHILPFHNQKVNKDIFKSLGHLKRDTF